ncbi:MAG: hypothetical protein H0U49_01290, partial [Parachlamydiaceae bacterium]|nr:hypothetical protein [Parachlamydiaceae bacterium]
MFNTGSENLNEQDQNIAKFSTVIFGILTFGIVYLICRNFFYDKNVTQQSSANSPKVTAATQKIQIPSKKETLVNFIMPYNEEPLQALDSPCYLSELTTRLKHHSKIKELTSQFDLLNKNYYFQRARGGGNCFYLSYASSVL